MYIVYSKRSDPTGIHNRQDQGFYSNDTRITYYFTYILYYYYFYC